MIAYFLRENFSTLLLIFILWVFSIIYEQKQMFSNTNIWSVCKELRVLGTVKAMSDI